METRVYDTAGRSRSGVASLRWDDGRVVQISGAEDDDSRGKHVLIRVWPENGTAEDGGGNITDFSIVLRPDGEHWVLHSLHVDGRHLPGPYPGKDD